MDCRPTTVEYVVLSFCHEANDAKEDAEPDYQLAKKEYKKTAKAPKRYTAEELDRGFNTKGLWAWSRHPNFFAEQG